MPSLLSGLKHNPWLEITAVVSMFDNGRSSGELRDKFGILPPGDVLKCLLALSEDETAARKILLKRIDHPAFSGHTGGNLLLMAFEKVYGDHLSAVNALAQVLSARGRVVPITSLSSNLCAEYADKSVNKGETDVDRGMREGKEIKRLFLDPPVRAVPIVLAAIKKADVLCIGPGSLYTSVLPNFLPDGVSETIKKSKAPVIFIANLLTEGLGMEKFKVENTANILEKHLGRKVSAIIVNGRFPDRKILAGYSAENKYPLKTARPNDKRIIFADLWTDNSIARHDSNRLANLVSSVISKLI